MIFILISINRYMASRQGPLVVFQELPNPSLRLHFDTDSDEGPRLVEGVLQDAAQDPEVNAVHSGFCSNLLRGETRMKFGLVCLGCSSEAKAS